MRNSSPQTVDISAQPLSGFTPAVVQQRDLSVAVRHSLGVDIFLIFASLLIGVLFSTAIGALTLPAELASSAGRDLYIPAPWLIVFVSALPALLFTAVDGLSAASNPVALPYARSRTSRQAIYANRVHVVLLALYFAAILVALCWSAIAMPLISKIFVSAIFSFALYALGQSIPSTRMSFIVSGILFLVVLIATQAFIVMRLEASSGKATQSVLDELVEPVEEETNVFEGDDGLP